MFVSSKSYQSPNLSLLWSYGISAIFYSTFNAFSYIFNNYIHLESRYSKTLLFLRIPRFQNKSLNINIISPHLFLCLDNKCQLWSLHPIIDCGGGCTDCGGKNISILINLSVINLNTINGTITNSVIPPEREPPPLLFYLTSVSQHGMGG